MLTLRLIRREARTAWPVAAVLALLAVLLTAVPLSWPPRFDRLAAGTLADRVDRAEPSRPVLSAGVVTVPAPWRPAPAPGTLDRDLDRIGGAVRAAAGLRRTAVLGTPWARVTTGLASVRGPGVATFYGDDPPGVTLVHAQHDGPDGPVEYLRGRAPQQPAEDLAPGIPGEKPPPVEVAASEATREKFNLALGQPFELTGAEWSTEAVLVGVFRTDRGAQRLWQRSPLLVRPWPVLAAAGNGTKWEMDAQLLTSAGGIELLARQKHGFDVTWELPLTVDRSGPGATAAGIAAAREDLAAWRATPSDRLCDASRSDPCLLAGQEVRTLSVADRLTPELDAFAAQRLRTEQLQGFALAGLLAVVVATAFAAARLGVHRRAGAFALQRSRGAGAAGIAGRLLLESAVAVGAGVAVGQAIGRALAPPGAGLGPSGPVLVAALLVWCAPAVVLLARTGRGRPRPRSRRLVLEGLVLLSAVGGLAALRTRGAFASSGIDPQLAFAPVLLALVVVGLLLRLLPPALRRASRGARRSRGLVPLVALARAGQRRGAAALALLVLVPAMGYGVYGGLIPRTLADGREQLADWRTGGAPVALVGSKERLAGDLSKVPTVGHQVTVTGATGDLVAQSDGTAFEGTRLVGLDAAALGAARPSSPMARALAAAPGADAPVGGSDDAPVLTALADPGLAALAPDGDFVLSALGMPRARVRVVGALPREAMRDPVLGPVLGSAPKRGAVLVFTGPSARRLPAQTDPSAVLLHPAAGGPAVDPAAVRAAAATQLAPSGAAGPQAELRDRAHELEALGADGLAHALDLAFRVTTVLGLLLGLAAFALDLLLTAGERARTTSCLRTLGTGGRAVFALQLLQLLPLVLAAALGGTAFGLLLPSVLGPGLRLGAVTGGPFEPATHIDWTVTAGLGVALAVLMTTAAALEAAIARRRGLGAVLRLGEAL
ncbi:hypothetical protein ACFVVL_29115 [Kitasatospora sp. NPDC058115]|uniref:hypothetical protein n=1 Tax=Kitasatospora sp. NPDC058115 TaxID=3346347 RepID=UPI0036DD024E